MKKLVAFAAIVAAVSFASCGNKSAQSTSTEATAETETVVEETATAATDSTATVTEEGVQAESDSTATAATETPAEAPAETPAEK